MTRTIKVPTANVATRIATPPRMQVIWEVLEAAKDAGDAAVVAACRRLIDANRCGWRKHARAADVTLVYAFAEMI